MSMTIIPTRNKDKLSTIRNENSLNDKSFINTGIKLFNKLPAEVKKLETINSFKHHLFEFLVNKCIYDIEEL